MSRRDGLFLRAKLELSGPGELIHALVHVLLRMVRLVVRGGHVLLFGYTGGEALLDIDPADLLLLTLLLDRGELLLV